MEREVKFRKIRVIKVKGKTSFFFDYNYCIFHMAPMGSYLIIFKRFYEKSASSFPFYSDLVFAVCFFTKNLCSVTEMSGGDCVIVGFSFLYRRRWRSLTMDVVGSQGQGRRTRVTVKYHR